MSRDQVGYRKLTDRPLVNDGSDGVDRDEQVTLSDEDEKKLAMGEFHLEFDLLHSVLDAVFAPYTCILSRDSPLSSLSTDLSIGCRC